MPRVDRMSKKIIFDECQLKQFYESGLSAREIATKMGCGETTMVRRLKLIGCQLRHKRRYNNIETNPFLIEQIKTLYINQHLPTKEVAKKLGITENYAYRYLKKIGCIRNPKEARQVAIEQGRSNVFPEGHKLIDSNGYIKLKLPNYHRGDHNGYVPEHILVWEEYHHRKLPKGWVVHHFNGIKPDNRPQNLVAMKNGEHIHQAEPFKKKIRQLEIENRQLRRALEDSQMIMYLNEN